MTMTSWRDDARSWWTAEELRRMQATGYNPSPPSSGTYDARGVFLGRYTTIPVFPTERKA